MNERDAFLVAIEIDDPNDRAAYLDQVCAENAELRARVEELLQSHQETSQFLETPAMATDSLVDETIRTPPSNSDTNTETDSLPGAEYATGEAEFRKYLDPATRDGWLGRLGHYEIEEILGRGAFGIVAKAFDDKLHRVVAIKLMSPELATTSPPRKRFLREARTAAAVTHENIVAIYAVEEEPIPYLVMEYIPGQTLQQRMNAQGPLEVGEILRIGQQVASGLAAAHAMQLIHRDIKPSNIILSEGLTLRAKITDFGLARAIDDASLTTSGLIAGTPMYMAPEQARGETLDHRADLFSLGSVLYRMASGRPPFRAANTVAVLKRVCEDQPRPLEDVIPETPKWLETIILRLMEKDRNDRFQSAQEVAELLARCQRELEHDGKVTCVQGRSDTAAAQVIQVQQPPDSGSGKKPLVSLVGGVIATAAIFGIALMNRDNETPDPDAAKPASGTAALSPVETPTVKPTGATGWHGWPVDAPPPAIAPFDADQAQAHQEAWAKYLDVPVEYENSIGMKFRLIPPGEFLMGSTQEELEAGLVHAGEDKVWQEQLFSELPQHRVRISQPFYMATTEVTQQQYQLLTETNPSQFSEHGERKSFVEGLDTSTHPVENVSWRDAMQACAKLTELEQLKPMYAIIGEKYQPLSGNGYQLPTEAQWEYACRAGTTSRYSSGNDVNELYSVAWNGFNSQNRTHAVAKLQGNPFGLHDLHGNVYEWVLDHWSPDFYTESTGSKAIDPLNPYWIDGRRICRGGSWNIANPIPCFSAHRKTHIPSHKIYEIGFRPILSVDAVKEIQ